MDLIELAHDDLPELEAGRYAVQIPNSWLPARGGKRRRMAPDMAFCREQVQSLGMSYVPEESCWVGWVERPDKQLAWVVAYECRLSSVLDS